MVNFLSRDHILSVLAARPKEKRASRNGATTQRKVIKKKTVTENEIAGHAMDAAFLILLKPAIGAIKKNLVASLRRCVKNLGLTRRRNGATKS